MRNRLPALAAALAAFAIPASLVAPASPAAAQRDWSRTVVATPEGGFRMGNPDAPLEVVEFVSLTCNHCAAFAREGVPVLVRDHVRSGRVSLEYRNFVLNVVDMSASVVARCGGTASFFPITSQILAGQDEWMARFEAMSEAERTRLGTMEPEARLARIAEIGGFTAIAARHGVTAERSRACFSDRSGLDRLARMQQAGTAAGVQGTPTFLVNGRLVQAHDWATLEPLLRAGR